MESSASTHISPHECVVSTGTRVHISLFDVGYATNRVFGGVGFALASPRVRVAAARGKSLKLVGFNSDERNYLIGAFNRLSRLTSLSPIGTVCLLEAPMAHVGFGRKTAVTLAALLAISRSYDHDFERETLWRASGRGGVSGIGLGAFFQGGLLIDSGRECEGHRVFAPSSMITPTQPPLLALTLDFPIDWRCILLMPPGVHRHGLEELRVFSAAPLPSDEIRQVIQATMCGLVAAVQGDDLDLAGEALEVILRMGFKRIEILGQPPVVGNLIADVRLQTGLPVGMSSMGPLVYVLCRDGDSAIDKVYECASRAGAEVLGISTFKRRGREPDVQEA